MKKKFQEFFKPKDQEVKIIWQKGLFVFDANSLLNTYRYSKETRDQIIKVMNKVDDRLWLPYQFAWEYLNNREGVIEKANNDSREIYQIIKESSDRAIEKLKVGEKKFEKHYPQEIGRVREIINDRNKKIDTYLKKIDSSISVDKDPILEKLMQFYRNKIAEKFSDEKIRQIIDDGKLRYERKIPPGYRDSDKKDSDQFGDLIAWAQIMEKSKSDKSDIILITGDVKEDWWKNSGKNIPRPELIRELFEKTGKTLLMYTFDSFIKYSNWYLDMDIKEDVVEEVERIRKVDETIEIMGRKEAENYSIPIGTDYFSPYAIGHDSLQDLTHGVPFKVGTSVLPGRTNGVIDLNLNMNNYSSHTASYPYTSANIPYGYTVADSSLYSSFSMADGIPNNNYYYQTAASDSPFISTTMNNVCPRPENYVSKFNGLSGFTQQTIKNNDNLTKPVEVEEQNKENKK
ncbi:MAG: PIN domain-containing protein [Patescibacteria group bacterium]|nr:PIN domain-containing protein [Patescibacteria group bacterium]